MSMYCKYPKNCMMICKYKLHRKNSLNSRIASKVAISIYPFPDITSHNSSKNRENPIRVDSGML